MRRTITAAITALLALSVAPAAHATSGPQCGATITKDTKLTRDLTCNGTGLKVKGYGVDLNLNGKTIRSSGVALDLEGLTAGSVTNGTVKGVISATGTDRATLSQLTITGDIGTSTSRNLTVRRSTIHGDLDIQQSRTPLVEDSRINGTLTLLAFGSRAQRNTIDAKGGDGIALVDSSAEPRTNISSNNIKNAASGVKLYYGGSNATIYGNTITDSAVGISNSGPSNRSVAIKNNTIKRIKGTGIAIDPTQGIEDIVISSNRISDVGGYGIHAPGSTGTGNVVDRAKLSPECTGPTCS